MLKDIAYFLSAYWLWLGQGHHQNFDGIVLSENIGFYLNQLEKHMAPKQKHLVR